MKESRASLHLVAATLALLVAGCGGGDGGPGGTGESRIPECGFSMALPSGWTTEDYAETEFYRRGDREGCWGMAKFCPLSVPGHKFASVAEFAKHLIEEDRFEGSLAELVSQRPLKVGEVMADAHEVVFKDTRGGYNLTLFIQMEGGEALQVFFHVAAPQYQGFRSQYPRVVESIRLATKRPAWDKKQ